MLIFTHILGHSWLAPRQDSMEEALVEDSFMVRAEGRE